MAIDSLSERLVSFHEAAKLLPLRRGGRPCNVATLYRWSTAGCKGIVLETIQVGCTKCTSREALDRFFRALTAKMNGQPVAPAPAPRAHRAAVRRAERILDKAGI